MGQLIKHQPVCWIDRTSGFLVIMVAVLAFPVGVLGQVSSNEINYFSRCRNIVDINTRANCYDDLYDRAVRAATPRNDPDSLMDENRRMREELARIRQRTGGTATDQNQPYRRIEPDQAANRTRDYGQNGLSSANNRLGTFGNKQPRVVMDDDGREELFDRIAELQKIPNGWVITLESGQIWRQMYSKRYALRKGQEVKISPTIWGEAYHLSVSKLGSFIQVERIR